MITIQATPDEINALMQLLHRACQHSGLDAAEAAAHWRNKIVTAARESGVRGSPDPAPVEN